MLPLFIRTWIAQPSSTDMSSPPIPLLSTLNRCRDNYKYGCITLIETNDMPTMSTFYQTIKNIE